MKKLLILVLIVLLAALTIFTTVQGISIGNFKILGVKGIREENKKLDEKIQQAGKLVEKDYRQVVSEVQSNAKKLKEEKKNYEDMTALAEGETQVANQIEKYEIETLWVRLGNHATSEGTVMQMDVIKGANSAADVYNLKFTATGSYISITDFISAIENDSTLGFKIEEFKMYPASSGTDLQATFVCKDITIKDVSATTPNTPSNQNSNTTSEGNTTNSVNSTNSTNTTNTSNTNATTNSTNNTATNTNVAQ